MTQESALFHTKLHELEKQHQRLYARITLAEAKDDARLAREIDDLKNEIAENNLMLHSTVASCRSPALQQLADVHLSYSSQMEALEKNLYKYMGETTQDKAEAAALFAEYALDYAAQADRFALLSALEAIHLQHEETEENV